MLEFCGSAVLQLIKKRQQKKPGTLRQLQQHRSTEKRQHRVTAAPQHSSTLNMDLLPREYFLKFLRIEKRRADRSKGPLSIALFSFRNGKEDCTGAIQNFLTCLHGSTRETDIRGWVDRDVIGLILPDTDEKGAKRCIEKVKNGNGSCSVITKTYPDYLFQELLAKDEKSPDHFPLDLDEPVRPLRFQMVGKRIIDIIGSVCGLLILSPILFVTAVAVKMTSHGPVIFKQSRLGRKGERFPFYKFRSMYVNGDDRIHREYVANLIQGNLDKINKGDKETPLYKMNDDPRITPVGKIIRKTSIDEFPQFLNVLKGEMSLVGPRPPIPYEVEKYEPWHLRRILEVKPGITGLWQVDGRSKTSFDDMVRMDLRYVKNWSLWLDVKILVKTVKAVLKPNGAV